MAAISTFRPAAALSVLLIGVTVMFLLAPASSIPTGDMMSSGDTLLAGKSLSSGEYSLSMQEDCNLVLRRGNNVTWESGTAGKGSDCFLYLQTNGLLLIYPNKGEEGSSVWKSETVASPAGGRFVFVLLPEGTAMVFGTPVWSTASAVGK